MRNQQSMAENIGDVPYNFLIGSNGLIFEGRGFNRAGLNMSTFGNINNIKIVNSDCDKTVLFQDPSLDTISVAFMGNFDLKPPSKDMIESAMKFFDDIEIMGKLSPNYRINIMADFAVSNSPGRAFIEIIKQTWPRYSPT